MTRVDDMLGSKLRASISLMIGKESKLLTSSGLGRELVRSSEGSVWIADASIKHGYEYMKGSSQIEAQRDFCKKG